MTQLLTCFRRALHTVGALLWEVVGGRGTRQQIHGMGASCAAGARKMLFFLQRDSHSAGCTHQTPPNRVSADSPSRILPGDVLASLRFPPPQRSYTAVSGGAEILIPPKYFVVTANAADAAGAPKGGLF